MGRKGQAAGFKVVSPGAVELYSWNDLTSNAVKFELGYGLGLGSCLSLGLGLGLGLVLGFELGLVFRLGLEFRLGLGVG